MRCPRCGMDNKGGRFACWNCFAQLEPVRNGKAHVILLAEASNKTSVLEQPVSGQEMSVVEEMAQPFDLGQGVLDVAPSDKLAADALGSKVPDAGGEPAVSSPVYLGSEAPFVPPSVQHDVGFSVDTEPEPVDMERKVINLEESASETGSVVSDSSQFLPDFEKESLGEEEQRGVFDLNGSDWDKR